ncbi:ral GTPase-activating protein subunit alpha-1-like isoform X1 [Daphnia pulex]|uniref:ral GTPase-activating protein subunit alpha-1-like isoform X1 n=1 Tax=Daphnia pulex TaxID=6669 RepID=UPI001EE11590|nr:ral GTPase-activating protein subunit alpha-1-like isoform X1 [Daphnia pulex]XP_046445728.1 ral GTPase-activating protein subunit alpha-1-like isoform X1 [Daphnia pulex]
MFSKKASIDVKKSTQKFLDGKRDIPTRFRHLKIVLDHAEPNDAKSLLETYYSPVFHIFYDSFTTTESTLKQKSHRVQREELDAVLVLLEKILLLLPELLQKRWQKHALTRLFKRLLHPANNTKLRKDSMKLFILWYQILGEQADSGIHSMFACLVPGFPNQPAIVYPSTGLNVATPTELLPLIPPQAGEKGIDDSCRFFLDSLMEFMITQVMRIEWRDKHLGRPQRCFSFLLQKFQTFFLPHIFPEISERTNVYRPDLDISDLRRLGPNDPSSNAKQPFICCRVVVLKWLANLTHVPQSTHHHDVNFATCAAVLPQHIGSPAMESSFYSQISEREAPTYISEQHRNEVTVVQDVLFGTRENVNLVVELYRQAFLLPLQQSPSIRKILSLYRDWIHRKVDAPPFMHEPIEDSVSQRNASREHTNVYAGMQNVLQIFITQVASVFMSWVPPGSLVFLEEQVDICKRVLNIYRYMVMNSPMEQKTWEQLLLVLLQVTSQVLGNKVPDKKEDTLGNRLAPALFQTLIVTWIRANLNVVITVDLWDQFVLTLSGLTVWEELIREWAKTMDILTRVLAKNLYHLDLSDLPLDRLSEQKAKKRRAGRVELLSSLGPFPQNIQPRSGQINTPATTPVSSPAVTNLDATGHHSGNSNPAQDETRSASGSVRSRNSVMTPGHLVHPQRTRHSSSGDTSLKTTEMWNIPRTKKVERSRSEGNFARKYRINGPRNQAKRYGHITVPTLPTSVENKITRMLTTESPSTAQLLRRPLQPRKQFFRKRSRSMNSIKHLKGLEESNRYSDSETESRSPSPSSGVETNSFKDSPMQIDVMGLDQGYDAVDGDASHNRSVMFGGKAKGWLPDVAVVMWRRMLGALGDPNEVRNPQIHAAIFDYLVELGSILIKIRQNQGVSLDNVSTPPLPAFVPPILILVPWCQKALALPNSYHKGKIMALRLLCTVVVRPHDIPLPRNQLLLFFRAIHHALVGQDQDAINTVIKYCGARFFSLQQPGYSLLMLDFLHAANTIISNNDLKGSSRVEAISVVGSLLFFPESLPNSPVLQPVPNEYNLINCNDIKEHIVALVLKSAKREATSVGRCVAISSLAVYVYCQLAHGTKHSKVKEAIAVLLAVLKQCIPTTQPKSSSNSEFKNRLIGQVACDMLLLLCDHADYLLEHYPDVPQAIVEDLSHTLSALTSNHGCNDQTKRLLLSLSICLGEWCMRVPYEVLLKPLAQAKSPPLLETVFRVLKSVATGSNIGGTGHVAGSRPLDIEDADPSVDNVGEHLSTLSPPHSPLSSPTKDGYNQRSPHAKVAPAPGENEANIRSVRLAARMVMEHLIIHLGHFPMGIGAARLSSMVCEHDDLPHFQGDELSAELFHSPSVQFFMLNKDTLMSLVELPTLEAPPGSALSGLQTARSQVRIILRNLGGKFCWDSSILYSLKDDSTLTRPVKPPPPLINTRAFQHEELMTSSFIGGDGAIIQPSPPRLSVRHRPPNSMPRWEDTAEDMDNLEDLLLFIGHTSPECIPAGRQADTLTTPPPPPPTMLPEQEEEALNALLHQKHIELDFYQKHSNDQWMRGRPAEEPIPEDPQSPFQFSRMLFSQLGLTSWDKRGQVQLLKKCDKLLRELKNLDSQKCRETHKIAVIYVGAGQEDKNSILTNSGGSQAFEDFVAGLAWEVELETHTGFLGGLQRNRSTGETAPYFATSLTEVIFHVSTRMPSHNQDALLQKTRHLGNDEVHIVWSEHSRDYRRGIIPTEFCDVLITIYPLPNQLFRIQISRKPDVPFVGPLFNECIIDKRVLPGLVRATALNASRATRSTIPYFHTFYEERYKALETITQNLQEPATFEDFCAQLCCPGVPVPTGGSSGNLSGSFFNTMDLPANPSSGPPSSSGGHVTFSSDTSYGFPASIFRHNSGQDKQRGFEGATSSADIEEPHYASPKANKRLSFKHTSRKISGFGNPDS